MGQSITIITLIIIWILSFVEPSGWSMSMNLPDKVNTVLCVLAAVFFVIYPNRRQNISRLLFLGLLLTFIAIPYMLYGSLQGASYLVVFLVVYIVSQGRMTHKVIARSGIIIAFLGLVIMYIYTNGSLLSGWNDNAISMVGLFSFIYFSIFLISQKGKKKFWFWNIITIAYLFLLFETNCRSGMLFSIFAICGIVFMNTTKKILNNSRLNILILNIPMLIALAVISVASTPYFDILNDWSLEHLEKDIFNGRDILWENALLQFGTSLGFGMGRFIMNYHNSGIAALSVFGVLGYICWIKYFSINLKEFRYYLKDRVVFGAMLGFLLIYLQQSVDLGFIAEYPNLLPYAVLGIGIGRVRLLRTEALQING